MAIKKSKVKDQKVTVVAEKVKEQARKWGEARERKEGESQRKTHNGPGSTGNKTLKC